MSQSATRGGDIRLGASGIRVDSVTRRREGMGVGGGRKIGVEGEGLGRSRKVLAGFAFDGLVARTSWEGALQIVDGFAGADVRGG